jgi:organic radical activating enzyme
MNFDRIFEIELSSLCNAKCSGCMRTMLDNKGIDYYKGNISCDNIKKWFKPLNLKETKIKLCGVLGDPIINPELEDILDYLLYQKNVKNIEISTNGGVRTKKFWINMAELSKFSNGRMEIHWSIDGVTKNDYRENVNLNKVWENLNIYNDYGGHSIWQYIEFDYNKDEISLAQRIAKEKNIKLYVRKSWRNNADQAKFKSEASKKIDSRTFEELSKKVFEKNYSTENIQCRHKIKNEYFISANKKLWPCCHLHDEYVAKKTNDMENLLNNNGRNFNNLEKRSIEEIINSKWYKTTLEESWNKKHPLHLPRCYLACGDAGKRAVIKEEYVGQ